MSLTEDSKKDELKVLSATRQKKSIGEITRKEKKQSVKRVITRQFVVHPKEIEWPLLSDERNASLIQMFAETITVLKPPFKKVSLREIRQVPKEQRREFRAKAKEANRLEIDLTRYSELRSSLSIGVNCVSKSLESNTLSAVLIDPDVNPQIITKLLIPIAQSNSVPILAIKTLEKTMKAAANIKCIALGFKKVCQDDSNHFNDLLKRITQYHEEYCSLKNQPASSSSTSLSSTQSPTAETPSRSSSSASLYKPAKVRKVVR